MFTWMPNYHVNEQQNRNRTYLTCIFCDLFRNLNNMYVIHAVLNFDRTLCLRLRDTLRYFYSVQRNYGSNKLAIYKY